MSTGNYYKNAFIIELEKLNKCLEFNDKGGHLIISRENPEDLKTFLHEYYHYVLNVSTFVRVRDIYLEYSLKSLFSRTMIQNGESKGDVDFSKAQDDSLKNMVDIKNAYNGDMYHADYKKMRITDIQYQSPNLKLESKDIPYSIAVLTIEYESFGKTRMKEINFGNLIFEESLCKNVEGIVIGANNLSDIPYRILNYIAEYLNVTISPKVIAYIGVMSLLTTNAPYSFIKALEELKQKKGTQVQDWFNDNYIIEYFKKEFYTKFSDTLPFIRASVTEVIQNYKGRGANSAAVEYYGGIILENLSKREKNICFDLDILLASKNYERCIKNLTDEVKICCLNMAISDTKFQFFAFDDSEIDNISVGEFTLTYSSENDFLLEHLKKYSFEPTKSLGDIECPHYLYCPMRYSEDEVCTKRPWQTLEKRHNCYYNFSISSLLGKYRIGKKV